jgi:superfamily II DNA/RNA helicase
MSQDLWSLENDFSGYFKEQGFKAPTLIQKKVIPVWKKKMSLMVLAETGAGKTLSFALPIVDDLKKMEAEFGPTKERACPRALVLAPTRELAQQLYTEFKKISHHQKLRVRVLSGGDSPEKTKNLSHSSFDILIATPHRLVAAMKRKAVQLGQVKVLVFDEADNLFEMGFRKDLDMLLSYLDLPGTQCGFFSATFPPDFEQFIIEKFSDKKLERILSQAAHQTSSRIETFNVKVNPEEKNTVVKMFLEKEAKGRGIVFANQKNQAVDLYNFLKEKLPKVKTILLHGDLLPNERSSVLESFRDKKAQVLIATDVAARGIDLEDLWWVVNFGLPKNAIYYLHRAGRIARGGKKGVLYNLVSRHDAKMIEEINQMIRTQEHLLLKPLPSERKKSEAPRFQKNAK